MPAAAPSSARPLARTAVALVLALALSPGLSACGDDGDPEPSGAAPELVRPSLPSVASGVTQEGVPQLVNITLADGRVSGVPARVPVALGSRVRVTVVGDVTDRLLVSGYDQRAQLTVGQPVQLVFLADKDGTFEVRLDEAGTVLTRLVVS